MSRAPFRLALLDASHDRSTFNCGTPALDRAFTADAKSLGDVVREGIGPLAQPSRQARSQTALEGIEPCGMKVGSMVHSVIPLARSALAKA